MKIVGRALRKRYDDVIDVSREESFDFLCRTRHSAIKKIEVKGTTTSGGSILVSRRELELTNNENVDLYIVRDIEVVKGVARRGDVVSYSNWHESAQSTKALGFRIVMRTEGRDWA